MLIVNHKYEDETGSGEIPRFIPTPGSNIDKMPPVQSLHCYILKNNGLTPNYGTGTLKSAKGSQHRLQRNKIDQSYEFKNLCMKNH